MASRRVIRELYNHGHLAWVEGRAGGVERVGTVVVKVGTVIGGAGYVHLQLSRVVHLMWQADSVLL